MRMLFAVILLSTLWQVQAKNLQAFIENPETVGEARLSVLFWDIYDASLIAQNGQFNSGGPFALTLTYLRNFDGNDIASRSIDEMRGQGMTDEMKLAKWYQELEQIFPDVQEGQTITGIMDANKVSHFYLEDQLIGSIKDAEFGKWFFDIWLSEKTSEPKMRQKLLGQQN